jgi:hypothetical protein
VLLHPAFYWHFFNDRFAQALASCGPQAARRDAMAHYAHYRLGQYRTAAEIPAQRPWYSVLASLVSLAACGRGEEVAARVDDIVRRRAHREQRAVLARALAPYAPELALQLIEGLPASPALRAALLMRAGRHADAAQLLDRTAPSRDRHAELALLRSNADPLSPVRRLAHLNEFIGQYGLAPLALRDTGQPPNALNLVPAAAPASVDGPQVSVLMTAWRAEGHIAAALGSLQRQTWRRLEIIVVDDASDDATGDTVRAMARGDERIRYLRLPRNAGTYVAKNAGLALASAEFVTCHDADDFAHPERIQRQVEPLLQDERLVFTTSDWVRIQDDGLYHARPVHPLMRLNPASPLFRKSAVLREAGAWDCVRTGADSEFHARLRLVFGARAARRLPMPLTLGAHRPGSLMTSAATGYDERGLSPTRLAYWEAWSHWHVATLRDGARPKLPAPDAPRRFAAPAEIDVPAEILAACLGGARS